jgi:hypothetical protein
MLTFPSQRAQKSMRRSLVAVLCLLVTVAVAAQKPAPPKPAAPPPPSNPLFVAHTLRCSFPKYATAEWVDGNPEILTAPQELTFRIDAIDPVKRSARIVSAGAAAEAAVVITSVGVSTIERTPIGNLILTTVFVAGAQGGSYLAIHSRHVGDLSSPPTASQNYGKCEIER